MKRIILFSVLLLAGVFCFGQGVKFSGGATAYTRFNVNTAQPSFELAPSAKVALGDFSLNLAGDVTFDTVVGYKAAYVCPTLAGKVGPVSGSVYSYFYATGVIAPAATVTIAIPVVPVTLTYALANLTGDKGTVTLSASVAF